MLGIEIKAGRNVRTRMRAAIDEARKKEVSG